MLFTDENGAWVTLFNKRLAEQYVQDVNLYDAVKTGTWTVDMLNQYEALANRELDGNDTMDQNGTMNTLSKICKERTINALSSEIDKCMPKVDEDIRALKLVLGL